MNNKTILLIHQSAELYGSDKTLFYLAKSINEHPFLQAIVVIPNDGPLKKLLEENNIEVLISPVIKISRSMFTFRIRGVIQVLCNMLRRILKLQPSVLRIMFVSLTNYLTSLMQ